jgi:hypothetical protein
MTGIRKRPSQLISDLANLGYPAGNSVPNKSDLAIAAVNYLLPVDGTNWTNAIARAQAALGTNGGYVDLPAGVILASQVTLKRFCILRGKSAGSTELQQISGSNVDFIISENFASLTTTGLAVGGSSLVPSWFGLSNLRVNGNKAGNTVGRCIAWYGSAQIMQGIVLVYNGATGGIYTEYTNNPTAGDWTTQEEAQFDNVIVRDNGGAYGWQFRGPHDCRIGSIIAGFNDGWGFYNEDGANFGGSINWVDTIHTYANGRSATPNLDTGCHLGSIAQAGLIMTDGDNLEISASNCMINSYRGYNIGGQQDGLVISGNANQIGLVNATVWSSSTGKTAINISGGQNSIGQVFLGTSGINNDGILISGGDNSVTGIYVAGFTGTGKTALKISGSFNRVVGELTNNATNFNRSAGTFNVADLRISTSGSQIAVAGAAPDTTDRFDIRSAGTQHGATNISTISASVPMDITTAQTITVAHGLLYTPSIQNIALTLLDSSPSSTAYQVAYMRVNSVDATNVTIGLKLAVAAAASTVATIGMRCGFR